MEPSSGSENGGDLMADVDLSPASVGTDLHLPAARETVENAIATIPGIIGARVVPGYERAIDELHVLASLEKQPKQAVRDVQTLLMARFGVTIDHRVVSVVQLDELPRALGASVERLVLERVSTSLTAGQLHVEVGLRFGDRELSGTGDGSPTGHGRYRAPAEAALDAVTELLGPRATLHLEGVDIVETMGRRLAITLVHLRAGRYETTLTGSAIVREADVDAIVRSVLDALNRTIDDTDQ
ncbi:hypothetical protein [Egicoccus sp. AB-alg6-2]|uniref:hypothetical protein n=1 Tax=Egicoccus sp. AB-alg6-2 TaxID=3242692 RepID=UPI00359CD92D